MICGCPVSASIFDLPNGIDTGIIMLPASQTPEALEACAKKGLTSAVLAAGGFAEVDEGGQDLQRELSTVIKNTGIRALVKIRPAIFHTRGLYL